MNALLTIALAVQMLTALAMIGLILVQHGKGADMGAAFGSGSSGSLFGATGSANFLSRATGVLAAVFFAATLLLAYFGNARPAEGSSSVLERIGISPPVSAPASAPVGAAGQIPAGVGAVPATSPAAAVPAAPAAPASGAAQIPTK